MADSSAMVQGSADVGAALRALIDDPTTDYAAVRDFLGALSVEQKRQAIEAVGGRKRQRRLWELGEAGPAITIEDLVPSSADPLDPVIFYGKNSLPLFTIFQKRMARTADGEMLLGYNHSPPVDRFVGPGFFVVDDFPDGIGKVGVDYTRLPDKKPESWPTIKPNKSGLSRFVYYDMIDYLRELAPGVLIGRAVKGGKITQNYFLLSREK